MWIVKNLDSLIRSIGARKAGILTTIAVLTFIGSAFAGVTGYLGFKDAGEMWAKLVGSPVPAAFAQVQIKAIRSVDASGGNCIGGKRTELPTDTSWGKTSSIKFNSEKHAPLLCNVTIEISNGSDQVVTLLVDHRAGEKPADIAKTMTLAPDGRERIYQSYPRPSMFEVFVTGEFDDTTKSDFTIVLGSDQ